ncbi:hypothetical protein G5C60_36350 [Streptomyces sp. HC44]|uniref:Secreted protein n=1 Tax=Streptomyces scabichelini TaxID=2711217 RepID=A0A6G4VFR1_9ACTN|nr:hypothetical protein [Streptomyces scabichelini]NGO12926.1 hypothetical protein [Streptomyces scabichelini]
MAYMRQRLTILTLSVLAVLSAGLVGSSPASAQAVEGGLCTNGSASLDIGGTHLAVGRGAQDDCVRFSVG